MDLIADGDDDTSEILNRKIERLEAQRDGLKILFWNIRHGSIGKTIEKKSLTAINPLEHNIRALINSELSPDILIMSEFEQSAVSEATIEYILHHYTIVTYMNITPHAKTGIVVFANLPIQGSARHRLKWAPLIASRSEKKKYRDTWIKEHKEALYWDRSYWRLSFEYRNKYYHIAPVHLLQPWNAIRKQSNFVFGFFEAGITSLFSDDNPLVNQVRRLLSAYTIDSKGRIGDGPCFDRIHSGFYPNDRAIILGDFNTLKSFLGIESPSYKHMTRILTDAFDNFEEGNEYTHPTPSAPEYWSYPNFKIDHAFVNNQVNVKAAEVLPLQGSDHFPIYLSIE